MAAPVTAQLLFLLLCLAPVCSFKNKSNNSSTIQRTRAFVIREPICNTTLPKEQMEAIQSSTMVVLVPLLYLVSFVIGLPANLLALWVLLFRTKRFPSTILLINLTCCDLLLLLLLPFRITYHFRGNDWTFGETSCRMLMALFYGNVYGSVICLMLIAVDRYVALVHPFGAKTLRSRKISVFMSVIVWVVLALAALPLLTTRQTYTLKDLSITTCHDALPREEQKNYFLPYFATLFFFCFLLPLFVVVFCYGSVLRTLVAAGSRYAHATRVTALILVVFVICFLPSNILLLLHYSNFKPNRAEDYIADDCNEEYDQLYIPYMISLAIGTFNNCLDPFIFYYVSEEFREKAKNVLCCSRETTLFSSRSSSSTSRSKVTMLSMSSKTKGLLENDSVKL